MRMVLSREDIMLDIMMMTGGKSSLSHFPPVPMLTTNPVPNPVHPHLPEASGRLNQSHQTTVPPFTIVTQAVMSSRRVIMTATMQSMKTGSTLKNTRKNNTETTKQQTPGQAIYPSAAVEPQTTSPPRNQSTTQPSYSKIPVAKESSLRDGAHSMTQPSSLNPPAAKESNPLDLPSYEPRAQGATLVKVH
jgi:hypothetical protein